jgi:hypothetical protein
MGKRGILRSRRITLVWRYFAADVACRRLSVRRKH